jgi:hypothetical protein
MTVIFAIGAIAVDVGLWLSEKRGAQTDADFPALAGAWELLPFVGNSTSAQQAVNDWADDNDETTNLTVDNIVIDDSCWNQGTDDAVYVEVTHDSRTLFTSIFGLVDEPPIRAKAKACAGAATGLSGIIPIELDNNPGPCFDSNEEPKFTSFCPIELGAQGGNPRGIIDLQASGDYCSESGGSGDIEDLIEWGATGNCFIKPPASGGCNPQRNGPWYDCVAVQTGNPAKVLDGVFKRVSRDGDCDQTWGDGDGLDEFDETVELLAGDPITGLYEGRDCDPNTEGKQISPRLVTIVVLENPPVPGNVGYPILAFAGFYLAGCTPEDVVVTNQSQLDSECDRKKKNMVPGGGTEDVYLSSPELGPVPAPAACHRGTPHGQQTNCNTPTPTPTPGPPTPTPTPGPPAPTPTPPPGGNGTGHSVVWGQFVKLIVTNQGGVGAPNDQTTIFGIGLVE